MLSSIFDVSRFSPQALEALAADNQHLRHVLDVVAARLGALEQRLAELRMQRVPQGGALLQRDPEIHSLSQQYQTLSRLGAEICLGRFDRRDGKGPDRGTRGR